MNIHCPTCGKLNDVTNRTLYDRIYCACGQWVMIAQRRSGVWYGVKVSPPTNWPKERR